MPGWAGPGAPGKAPEPFDEAGMRLVAVSLSAEDVRDYYEGFSNDTLWPLYHDVIAPPRFRRAWWDAYVRVNRRFAQAAAEQAAEGAVVWVQDYQLQLVPGILRAGRPDLRIGFFNHIPFPGYEIFAQLPWRRQIVEGLLGADLVGFQRQGDATNFLRACRRAAGLTTRGSLVRVPRTWPRRHLGQLGGPAAAPAGPPPRTTGRCGRRRFRSRSTRRASRRSPAGPRSRPGRPRSGRPSDIRRPCCSGWTGSTTPRASRTGSRPTASCWPTAG